MPPAGEERHRRLADEVVEAAGERGPRDARSRRRAPRPSTGAPGSLCSSRSARPTTGRRARGTSRAPSASGRANQARSTAISSRSSSRSSTASWPGLVLARSRRRAAATSGQSHSSSRSTSSGGSAPQQPPADLALELVGAGQQHGLAVRAVAPRAHAEVAIAASSSPVRRRAALARVDDDLRRRGRVVGDGVRVRARARSRRRRGRAAAASPSSGTIHASPRTTATSVSGASSWMRSDHGGSRLERSRNAPRARGPSSSPATASIAAIVDARA